MRVLDSVERELEPRTAYLPVSTEKCHLFVVVFKFLSSFYLASRRKLEGRVTGECPACDISCRTFPRRRREGKTREAKEKETKRTLWDAGRARTHNDT